MKHHIQSIFTLIFILSCTIAQAQYSGFFAQGARSTGMAGNGVSLMGIESMRSNQACLTSIEGISIGLHVENRFLISSIHSVALDVAVPTKLGIFGISVNSIGDKSFKHQKVGLAYARKLFKKLSIGGQFDIINTDIVNYGNKVNLTFELGLYSEIFDKLHASAHIFSPGKVKISEEDPLSSHLRFGLKYLVSKKLKLYSELNKNLTQKYDIRFGAEYQLINALQIRLGVATRYSNYAFGLTYHYKKFYIDLGYLQHPELKSTPALSVKYGF